MVSGSIIIYGRSKSGNKKVAFDIVKDIFGTQNERYLNSNSHPDFLMIEKADDANEISISQARSVVEFLGYTSERDNGVKVVFIDSAERMNRNAANAMLKILEEPPQNSLIILTTSKLFALLPTIRSRCKKYFVNTDLQSGDRGYDIADPFVEKCINFFDNGLKDMMYFAKSITLDSQRDVFIDISLMYAYCKFMDTELHVDAKKYLQISEFIENSRNTHIDQQSLILSICCLILS